MIRLIGSKYWNKLVLIVGHKKFSFLRISEFSLIQQERILFGKEIRGGEWGDKVHNSGERKLSLSVASKEEQEELCEIFKEHGFRIIDTSGTDFPGTEKRFWLDPKKINSEGNNKYTHGQFPQNYCLTIRLYRKDLRTFLDLLKKLSKEFNYRVGYDELPRHHYYYCRKPETYIIK